MSLQRFSKEIVVENEWHGFDRKWHENIHPTLNYQQCLMCQIEMVEAKLAAANAQLQSCADVYGKWEKHGMDANEAIGWVGNYTRALGFKPVEEKRP
jgi:hypothetical protein